MFKGRFSKDGGLDFSDYYRNKLRLFIRQNPNMPFEISPLLPESRKQRNFFEGAIVPLITYYQEGMDYRSSKDREKVREWLKLEFNSEIVVVGGKKHRVAQSTKNKLSQGFLESVGVWFIGNYSPPIEALDVKKYQHWKDAIYPYGGSDTYIGYLQEINVLK